jgi:UDP:flavonoid glycosyltransferase YjiC (YdhE family)
MRLALIIELLVIGAVVFASKCSAEEHTKEMLLVTYHHWGHITPMNALAEELASRSGVTVSIASFEQARARATEKVPFVSLGAFPWTIEEDAQITAKVETNFITKTN